MTNITIRDASYDDAGLIADMSRDTFYDTFAAYNTRENMDQFLLTQFSRDSLIKEVQNENGLFLLAYLGDEPAGYARLRESIHLDLHVRDGALEICRIYATRESIGNGVGRALMERSIRIAEEKNKKIVWLGVWEHNARAIEFYKKWGFEKFGEQIFMLGEDMQTDWLMKKNL